MRQSAVINLILRRSIPLSLGKRHLPQLCLNHLFLRVTGFKVAKNSAPLNTAGEPRRVYPGVPGLPIRKAAERKGKGRRRKGYSTCVFNHMFRFPSQSSNITAKREWIQEVHWVIPEELWGLFWPSSFLFFSFPRDAHCGGVREFFIF